MKLWLTSCSLPNFTNHHRPTPSNTLLTRHLLRLLLNCTYHPRCKVRLNHSLPPRQWCLYTLYLPFPTHRSRPLLRLISPPRNLKHWHYTPSYNHNNSFHGLCSPMRPNVILGGNSNHKPTISNPVYWNQPSPMNLRRIRHRQPHSHTILHLTLYPTLHYHRPHNCTPTIPTRNRIKQPLRNLLRLGQNRLPPLLHNQRHPRPSPPSLYPSNTNTTLTQPPKRPRQLHPSRPTKYSPTHQARMVLPICIHNPTIHPQQTGRRTSTLLINLHPSSHPHTPQIQTTKHNIPPTQPIPVLTPNNNPINPYLNWKRTSNSTPYHYRPSSIHNILHHNSNPNTTGLPNRKQPTQMNLPS
nr:uncharacterized protein LOC102116649 [Macaca fascicularis]